MSKEEDDFWRQAIEDARHNQLDTVRKAAAGWLALFTAVLGVFGTVTFATGLTGLNDLSDTTRVYVRIGIAVAAVATLAATILAGSAANSVPHVTSELDITSFQVKTNNRAKSALNRLRGAMVLGAVAAAVVVAGSFLVLFSNPVTASTQPAPVIAEIGGKAYCGTPTASADGTLSIGGTSLNGAKSIVVVGSCAGKH
jgi:hypothetical protein